MKYCMYCGKPINDDDKFCTSCGREQTDVSAENTDVSVENTDNNEVSNKENNKENNKKNNKKAVNRGLIVTAVIVAVAICVICGIKFFGGTKTPSEQEALHWSDNLPEITYSYKTKEPEIDLDYEMVKEIAPITYSRLDSIMSFTASCDGGDKDIVITAEVPGLTQVYEKKFTIGKQITKFYIHPALLTGDLNLNSAKEGQINFTVKEADTGEVLIKDTGNIRIRSIHDVPLSSTYMGRNKYDVFLALLTPEDESIAALKRQGTEAMSELTDGAVELIAGYQKAGFENQQSASYYQTAALQLALSELGVRYTVGSFSMTDDGTHYQRVQLPKDTINNKGGLCVETALTIASALQSADMHVFLLFPPGHCQIAVEAIRDSGYYILLETTSLPVDKDTVWNACILKNPEHWQNYLNTYTWDGSGSTDDNVYVLDCDMARKLDFRTMTN